MTTTNVLANLRRDLAERRAAAGLSLEEVAERSGIPHTVILDVERGATTLDIEAYVDAIAYACGFDPMDSWRIAVGGA